jgi:hypothetical protein
MGQRDEALAIFRRSQAIRERLAAADPANLPWKRDLSNGFDRIGDLLLAIAHHAEAIDAYGKALTIRTEIAAAEPSGNDRHALVVSQPQQGW